MKWFLEREWFRFDDYNYPDFSFPFYCTIAKEENRMSKSLLCAMKELRTMGQGVMKGLGLNQSLPLVGLGMTVLMGSAGGLVGKLGMRLALAFREAR